MRPILYRNVTRVLKPPQITETLTVQQLVQATYKDLHHRPLYNVDFSNAIFAVVFSFSAHVFVDSKILFTQGFKRDFILSLCTSTHELLSNLCYGAHSVMIQVYGVKWEVFPFNHAVPIKTQRRTKINEE